MSFFRVKTHDVNGISCFHLGTTELDTITSHASVFVKRFSGTILFIIFKTHLTNILFVLFFLSLKLLNNVDIFG